MALISFVLSLKPARDGSCDLNPPLECNIGSELILRVDPNLTVDGTGIVVATIIDTSFSSGLFHYVLQYDDALVIQPLVQADVIEFCCMDCIGRFAQAIGGSTLSSMQDNGNYASGATDVQHNNGLGGTFDFAEGFQTVHSVAFPTCPGVEAGVGPQRAVRAVSIVADELFVDAAPEHDAFGSTVTFPEQPRNIDIAPLGTRLIGLTPSTTFFGPNCRGWFSLGNFFGYVEAVLSPGGEWEVIMEVSVNGGAFFPIWSRIFGPSTTLARTENWFVDAWQNQNVPPNTLSWSFAWQIRVTTNVAPGGAAVISAARLGFAAINVTNNNE